MCKISTILFVFLLLLTLSFVFMGDRYKSKYFKDFSGGEGMKFLTEEKAQYHASSKVQVSEITKKISLQKDLVSNTLAFSLVNRNMASDGSYIYTLIYDSGAGFYKLYRSNDGETFTLRFTFAATYTDNTRMGFENGILFIFFGGGVGYLASSLDNGGSWTYTAGVAIENNGLMVSYWPKLNNWIYYQYGGASGPTIARTKNFITVEDVYAYPGNDDMEQVVEFDGFIYFVISNTLYRLENNEPIRVRSFQDYPMMVPIGKEALAIFVRGNSYSRTLLFDGAEFQEFERLTGYTTGRPLFDAYGFAYYTMYNGATYDIFKINSTGEIFKEYTDTGFMEAGLRFKDYDVFMDYGNTVKKSKNYKLAGTIDLPIIDEGDIIPVALIVRHKPLVAGTVVNVYVKKDQAATWGSALLVSSTTSAVKKEYKFPNAGPKCSFLQLEIELTSNSSAISPEDVSLEVIYLPAGLKNAK